MHLKNNFNNYPGILKQCTFVGWVEISLKILIMLSLCKNDNWYTILFYHNRLYEIIRRHIIDLLYGYYLFQSWGQFFFFFFLWGHFIHREFFVEDFFYFPWFPYIYARRLTNDFTELSSWKEKENGFICKRKRGLKRGMVRNSKWKSIKIR